jgi:hypothetical protein
MDMNTWTRRDLRAIGEFGDDDSGSKKSAQVTGIASRFGVRNWTEVEKLSAGRGPTGRSQHAPRQDSTRRLPPPSYLS